MQCCIRVHCSYCLLVFEVKGLTNPLYYPGGIPISMHISLRFIVHIVYLFLHGYGLNYNTRSKRVNKQIILWFTVQEEDQFLCKISGSLFTSFITCFYMVVACIIMDYIRNEKG